MEQLLKILKQLTGSAGALGKIPKPILVGMTFFTVFVGVFVILKSNKLDESTKTFLIIALVLLAVITGGYFVWKAWTQKQKNQQFGGEISQHSSATPRGLSDPGQRARLDDMRKKFQSGVEAYKSRGKDLYKLPWYVIVGEPGSGKTEAVRHSNVGFPPGMQDEFQGVGGTINMNWWFTNHAVLLDTAGRLMFEEVKPGETSEWKEFLTLLKKNRPNCPINGLFLVIPSDSLIKDSADAIQKKAGKIAQQLDVIQRVLDVRFPVFVVVTKCDKINGFREFFDGLTDPQLQHQMMGWSNPNPLDDPFKPEMVDKHLEQVGARLRRRRLGLLRDPVPENTEGRRTDEVDSFYAFPHSLELLSSRLRRYLETIFIAGEWSAKPLFLRGIYFSSSMREGSALDQELADVLKVSVDELPEGKVWERERAYFLRDLFLEKVFREKGLVTRASNTKRMLRGQQVALYGFGFAALITFSVLAWFAMGSLRSGVKDQGDYWHQVSAAGWEKKYWKQSIVPLRGDGSFASAIFTNTFLVDNKANTLGEFHVKLRDLADQRMKKNFMFPGLADKYNQNSRTAQRIVFEAGIVRPLVDAARQKMAHDDGEAGSAQRQSEALAELVRLESDILTRGTSTNNTGNLTPEAARKFLSVFESYIDGREVTPDTNLVAVMVWTYSTNETAKGSWPGRWLSGAPAGSNTLAGNAGINAGLELLARNASNSILSAVIDWKEISSLRASVKVFADSEDAMFVAAAGKVEANFLAAARAVAAARKDLDEQLVKESRLPLFAGAVSLTNAFQKFSAGIGTSADGALGRVPQGNDAALAANKEYQLFKEIKERLRMVQDALSNNVAQLQKSGDPKEFREFDENYLAEKEFASRADLYARAEKLMNEKPFADRKLIGLKGVPLERFLEASHDTRTNAAKYATLLKGKPEAAVRYYLELIEKKQSDAFFTAYLAEAQKTATTEGGFPLVHDMTRMMTADEFMKAGDRLKYISDDLESRVFQDPKNALTDRTEWKAFIANATNQQKVAKALLSEGVLGVCTINLAASTDVTRPKDEWQGTWRDLKLVFEGGNNEALRTGSEKDERLGEVPVQQKLELRLIKNVNEANSQTFSIATSEWGPIWLLHRYKGERDKADPKTWLVEFPVGAPGAKGTIRLKLKFERPLPELDKWPAK